MLYILSLSVSPPNFLAYGSKCSSTPSPMCSPPQGVLLPCPTTISAVNTTRTQLAQLVTAQQAISLHGLVPSPSAVNLLVGCVLLLPLNSLSDEAWSANHMRVAGQGHGTNGSHSPSSTILDESTGLRARVVQQVQSFVSISTALQSAGQSWISCPQ